MNPKLFPSVDSFYYPIDLKGVGRAAAAFKTGSDRLLIFQMTWSKKNPETGNGIITVLQKLQLLSIVHEHSDRAVMIRVLPKLMQIKSRVWRLRDRTTLVRVIPNDEKQPFPMQPMKMEYAAWTDIEGINAARSRELWAKIKGSVSIEKLTDAVGSGTLSLSYKLALALHKVKEEVLTSLPQYVWEN